VLLASDRIFAQSYQGEVRGLVVDPNKSIIVGATVTLVDEAKNVSRTTVSDGAGQCVFTQVDPAKYTVRVESAGFKAFRRTEVVVGTQQSVTVDVSLSVGDTSETVQVSAGETRSTLQTDRPQLLFWHRSLPVPDVP
jgi:trimeric autotransporter adhesin